MMLIKEKPLKNFQPKTKIISSKTKRKIRYMSISKTNSFFEQFQYTNNIENMFPHIISPRISSELNLKEKARYHGRTMALYHINRRISCECGCMVDIMDEIHGEVLCPCCGLVHYQVSVLNENKGVFCNG